MIANANIVVRELTNDELQLVGGGLNWVNVIKAVVFVSAAIAIGGPAAGAMVASDMLNGGM